MNAMPDPRIVAARIHGSCSLAQGEACGAAATTAVSHGNDFTEGIQVPVRLSFCRNIGFKASGVSFANVSRRKWLAWRWSIELDYVATCVSNDASQGPPRPLAASAWCRRIE